MLFQTIELQPEKRHGMDLSYLKNRADQYLQLNLYRKNFSMVETLVKQKLQLKTIRLKENVQILQQHTNEMNLMAD